MRSLLFGLVLLLSLSSAFAQERALPIRDPAASPGIAPASQGTASIGTPTLPGLTQPLKRDPFAASEKIRSRAERRDEPGQGFVPAQSAVVPHLTLRGYVEPRGRPAAALIEIDGQGVYLVRAGDTLGITVQGRNTVLRVLAVEAQGARIEAGSFGQVIVIR